MISTIAALEKISLGTKEGIKLVSSLISSESLPIFTVIFENSYG